MGCGASQDKKEEQVTQPQKKTNNKVEPQKEENQQQALSVSQKSIDSKDIGVQQQQNSQVKVETDTINTQSKPDDKEKTKEQLQKNDDNINNNKQKEQQQEIQRKIQEQQKIGQNLTKQKEELEKKMAEMQKILEQQQKEKQDAQQQTEFVTREKVKKGFKEYWLYKIKISEKEILQTQEGPLYNKMLFIRDHKFYIDEDPLKTINIDKLFSDFEYMKKKLPTLWDYYVKLKKIQDDYRSGKDPDDIKRDQLQQEQVFDEDATMAMDTTALYLAENVGKEKENPDLKNWKVKDKLQNQIYFNDSDILVNHLLAEGGQGSVYQAINRKTRVLYIFKQIASDFEYKFERDTYLKFQKNEQIRPYIFMDFFEYHDKYQLLGMSKAECNLQDMMEISYNSHGYQGYHLNKQQFMSLAYFQVKAMIEFEKIGIYLQDNKPPNILMQKKLIMYQLQYVPKYSDFGGIFDLQKHQGKFNYPSFKTGFYFDEELYNKRLGQKYSKQDIAQNEIYTIARSLQKCLFPLKEHQSEYFMQKDQMEMFIKKLQNNYKDENFVEIFRKMVDKDHEKRYKSFQELLQDIQDYIKKKNDNKKKNEYDMKIQDSWEDNKQKIKKFNDDKVEKFYEEYIIDCLKRVFDLDIMLEMVKNLSFMDQDKHALFFLDKIQRMKYNELNIEQRFQYYLTYGDVRKKAGKDYSSDYYRTLKIYDENKWKDDENKRHIPIIVKTRLASTYEEKHTKHMALDMYKEAQKLTHENFGENSIYEIDILYNMGNFYKVWENNLQKCLESYQEGLKISEIHQDKEQIAKGLQNLGKIYLEKKIEDKKKALECCERAVKINNELHGKTNVKTIQAKQSLSKIYLDNNQLDKAQQIYENILNITNTVYGTYAGESLPHIIQLGLIYVRQQNYQQARETLEQAIQMFSSFEEYTTTLEMALTYENAAHAIQKLEKGPIIGLVVTDNIKKYYGEAISSYGKVYKKNCKEQFKPLLEKGIILRKERKYQDSEPFIARAFSIFIDKKDLKISKEDQMKLNLEMGIAVAQKENLIDEAFNYIQESIDLFEQLFGKKKTNHDYYILCYQYFALLYNKEKNQKECQGFINMAQEMIDKSKKKETETIYDFYFNTSLVYKEKKDAKKEADYLQKTINVAEKLYGDNTREIIDYMLRLEVIYNENKMYQQAIDNQYKLIKWYDKDGSKNAEYKQFEAYTEIMECQKQLKKYKECIDIIQIQFKMYERKYVKKYHSVANKIFEYIKLSEFYILDKKYEEALKNYQESKQFIVDHCINYEQLDIWEQMQGVYQKMPNNNSKGKEVIQEILEKVQELKQGQQDEIKKKEQEQIKKEQEKEKANQESLNRLENVFGIKL